MFDLWLKVVAAIAIVLFMLFRRSGGGVLGYLAAFLVLIGLGPVVNYLLDQQIYVGVVEAYIPAAVDGYLFAVAGLLLADLSVRRQVAPLAVDDVRGASWASRYGFPVAVLLGISAAYGASVVIARGGALLTSDKLAAIQLAGPLHYPYLLVQICLAATYLLIRARPGVHKLFWANMAVYAIYCLLTSERDFLLVFVGIAIVSQNQKVRVNMFTSLLLGVVAAVVGAALFTLRGGEAGSSPVTVILGQGSLLFVDTKVLSYVPIFQPHALGASYLDSLVSALSFGAWSPGVGLSQWLISIYAPGSDSGYGFSMIGELVYNFGQWAILPAFFVLGRIIAAAVSRAYRSPFAAYLSTFAIVFLPYMLRSDSRGLFSGVIYALLLFAVLTTITSRRFAITRSKRSGDHEAARRR